MYTFWMSLAGFGIFSGWRFLLAKRNNKLSEWFDDLAIAGVASLVIFAFAYIFKEEIYTLFGRPSVTLSSNCTRTTNDRKYLYDCKIELKNSHEMALSDFKFVLESSAKYSNFWFVKCTPSEVEAKTPDTLSSETPGTGLADCKFKTSLGSFSTLSFVLTVNGDENAPDISIFK